MTNDTTTVSEVELPEIPEFDRKYVKHQPAGDRTFVASGRKADLIIQHVLTAQFSVKEIVAIVGCSASRVGEVLWVMDANLPEFSQTAWQKAVRESKKAAAEAAKTAAQ